MDGTGPLTGNVMNCEHDTEAIGDLVDGTIDQGRRSDLERHLAGCASCRALVDELRQIRAASARLPVHQPPERVWQRVSQRLQKEAPAHLPAAPKAGWLTSLLAAPRWRMAWAGGAALAVALLFLFVALPRLRPTSNPPVVADRTGPAPAAVHAGEGDLVQSVELELRAAEQHYQKAIGGLEQIATAGTDALDPQVAGTIRENLSVVDRAINDSRVALQSQPTNELAQESLFDAFRRKVGLLQDTVALINEMRKGNQAEAAKILGDMNK